jgi:hypothetical protein
MNDGTVAYIDLNDKNRILQKLHFPTFCTTYVYWLRDAAVFQSILANEKAGSCRPEKRVEI